MSMYIEIEDNTLTFPPEYDGQGLLALAEYAATLDPGVQFEIPMNQGEYEAGKYLLKEPLPAFEVVDINSGAALLWWHLPPGSISQEPNGEWTVILGEGRAGHTHQNLSDLMLLLGSFSSPFTHAGKDIVVILNLRLEENAYRTLVPTTFLVRPGPALIGNHRVIH